MTGVTSLRNRLRGITQLHEDARLVAKAQTLSGRFLVWVGAGLLLLPFVTAKIVIPAVALVMLLPAYRRLILSLGFVSVAPGPEAWKRLPLGVLLYLFFRGAKHFSRLPGLIRRRPQIWLHLLLWAVLVLIWTTPDTEGLWRAGLLAIGASLPPIIWRCGYMLMAGRRGKAATSHFWDHLYYLSPVYGGGSTPVGKGYDYLSQHEGRSAEAFARAQLAGIKLLILAWLWKAALVFLNRISYGQSDHRLAGLLPEFNLGIPPLGMLIDQYFAVPLPLAWVGLYIELVRVTLAFAIDGHLIIGALRLCGFNVFRNTYKPLLSETIVDFWNRFVHYFKELLVEFFFFPSYVRYFKTRPRLRMFTATFAAAFVGNLYYHAIVDADALVAADFSTIGRFLSPRVLYCFLLAVGVYFSMLRQQKQRGKLAEPHRTGIRFRQLRRIAVVWTFYALIHIWNLPSEELTFLQRTNFFLSLFGLEGLLPL